MHLRAGAILCLLGATACAMPPNEAAHHNALERVVVDAQGDGFMLEGSGQPWHAWGFNYDHDRDGRLLEAYWMDDWPFVVEDFAEMRALGANVVRVHLQVSHFLDAPDQVNADALARLDQLVDLAAANQLYLNFTGLGCYHKAEVPAWYDALPEAERWQAQATFWRAIAQTCAGRSAVFCFDLMNEPILPGADEVATDWLAGEFAGKHFVQRIALELAGRTRQEVAQAWIEHLVDAIRAEDSETLITVGVIPWAFVWPNAQPIFHDPQVGAALDFVSIHTYPEAGEVEAALAAVRVYDLGKPLVVEEFFPLRCSLEEMAEFVDGSSPPVDGWISFYWGATREELRAPGQGIGEAIQASWLDWFAARASGG